MRSTHLICATSGGLPRERPGIGSSDDFRLSALRAEAQHAHRGYERAFGRLPREGKGSAWSQLGGLGVGLAGLRRRRIRNPGSLLSFS
jgi:hypothetical protein